MAQLSAAERKHWGQQMAQWLGGVPLWSTRQGELDAERLHHAQQVATLTGERDAARRECAELRERVVGLEARVTGLVEDRQFYYQLFQDAQRQEVR